MQYSEAIAFFVKAGLKEAQAVMWANSLTQDGDTTLERCETILKNIARTKQALIERSNARPNGFLITPEENFRIGGSSEPV